MKKMPKNQIDSEAKKLYDCFICRYSLLNASKINKVIGKLIEAEKMRRNKSEGEKNVSL